MCWRVEIAFTGQCNAHGGDGKKDRTVSFRFGQENSGNPLETDRRSDK